MVLHRPWRAKLRVASAFPIQISHHENIQGTEGMPSATPEHPGDVGRAPGEALRRPHDMALCRVPPSERRPTVRAAKRWSKGRGEASPGSWGYRRADVCGNDFGISHIVEDVRNSLMEELNSQIVAWRSPAPKQV